MIVVDDQDAIPGPPQGDRVVGEGVLPLPRLTIVENLLGVGLSHVNDGKAVEVEVEDLGRSQDTGLPGQARREAAWRPRPDRPGGSRSSRLMVGLLVGGRPWELLSDDAAEGQERPLAVRLGEGLPEVRQMRRVGSASAGAGGTGRAGWLRMTILRAEAVPGDAGSNPPASRAPEPRLWGAAMRIDKPELRVQSVCFFCPEQWRLQHGLGLEPANRAALAAGERHHSRKAVAERVAGMLIAVGRVLLVLAVLAVLLLLVFSR